MLLLAYTVPRLLGPLAGALADRWNTRALMIGADLTQAGVFLALAWSRSWPVVATLVALAALGATLYLPAGRSNVPRLVPAGSLTRANALLAAGPTWAWPSARRSAACSSPSAAPTPRCC